MRPSFHSERFEFASGNEPSGNGNWAFSFDRGNADFFFNGDFEDAKEAAQDEGERRGASRCDLGS